MLKRSHALIGAAAGVTCAHLTSDPLLVGGIVGAVAGVLPDIDHPSSAVGRLLPKFWHRLTPGHRGPTHSVAWCGVLGLLIAIWSPLLGLLAFAGSLSHVCSDAITEAGVPWLYPFSKERLALPRLLAIRTGGWAEGLVVVGVLAGVGWWVAQ